MFWRNVLRLRNGSRIHGKVDTIYSDCCLLEVDRGVELRSTLSKDNPKLTHLLKVDRSVKLRYFEIVECFVLVSGLAAALYFVVIY